MLKTRLITAGVIFVFLALLLIYGNNLAFAIAMGAVTLAAAWEWGRLFRLSAANAAGFIGLLFIAMILIWPMRAQVLLPVTAIAAVFWLSVVALGLRVRYAPQSPAEAILIGAIALLATWLAAIDLHRRGVWILLAAAALVWIADTGAYTAGRIWGQRKLAPTISPNKSWEGVWGGLTCALVAALIWKIVWPAPWAIVVLAALLVPFAVVGDLWESLLKRNAGVKDSSNLLPGHGGVLDRIDAQLPVLPIAALALTLWERFA